MTMEKSEKNPLNLNMVIHAKGRIERILSRLHQFFFSSQNKILAMKKILLLLLITQACFGQTDSTKVDSVKTIFKDDVVVSATRARENAPTTYQLISKEE